MLRSIFNLLMSSWYTILYSFHVLLQWIYTYICCVNVWACICMWDKDAFSKKNIYIGIVACEGHKYVFASSSCFQLSLFFRCAYTGRLTCTHTRTHTHTITPKTLMHPWKLCIVFQPVFSLPIVEWIYLEINVCVCMCFLRVPAGCVYWNVYWVCKRKFS